jgi:hypothetical protein
MLTKQDQERRERPVVLQYDAAFDGSPNAGRVKVVLFNAGLGPALRVEVTARYSDPDHPFEATYVHPAIPSEGTAEFSIPVRFNEHYPPGGVRGDGFVLSGNYRDRSQRNTNFLITDWARDISAATNTPPD